MSAVPWPFVIVEQSVVPYAPDRPAGDRVVDLGHFVVVADAGCGFDDHHGSGGDLGTASDARDHRQAALDVVTATFARLDGHTTARVAFDVLSAALGDLRDGAAGALLPGVRVGVWAPARTEIWRVGDLHVRVGGVHHLTPFPPLDDAAAEIRARMLEPTLETSSPGDTDSVGATAGEVLATLLAHRAVFANRDDDHPLAFGILDGSSVPDRFVSVFPVASPTEVVIASNGYLSADGTLALAEADLADVLAGDPLAIRHYRALRRVGPSGSFDDRAWVRLRVG